MHKPLLILLLFASVSNCRLGLPKFMGSGDGSTGDDAAADASVVITDRSVTDEDVNTTTDSQLPIDVAVDAYFPIDTSLPADAGLVCPPTGPKDCAFQERLCVENPAASCYIGWVQQAVQKVINDHPDWFQWSDEHSCNIITTDINNFMDEVVSNIESSHNVCAIRDPNAAGEEITLKHDISFSENFDIVAWNGCARYGTAIFTGTCAPSWW